MYQLNAISFFLYHLRAMKLTLLYQVNANLFDLYQLDAIFLKENYDILIKKLVRLFNKKVLNDILYQLNASRQANIGMR